MTPGGQAQIGNVDLVKQLNSAAVYRLVQPMDNLLDSLPSKVSLPPPA